jgi:hypothetical protein
MKKLIIFSVLTFVLSLFTSPAFSQDSDNDSIPDSEDNCISVPNGPDNGTCTKTRFGIVMGTIVTCTDNSTCETGEICQMGQEDFNSNGVGDACECYTDFNGDGKVGSYDLLQMKLEFGRYDCNVNPCQHDLTNDGKVTLPDLVILRFQYQRTNCPN